MSSNVFQLHYHTDSDLVPRQTASQRVLEVMIQAPDSPKREKRPRLNLALVLDRSGSMSGAKLEYVKQAAAHIVDLLKEGDRVAVVTYDDRVDTLVPGAVINEELRTEIKQRIRRLTSGNMTNLSGGWLQGCQEVAGEVSQDTLTRALLLTDGLANHGITDPEVLNKHAQELSLRGVSTSTFGVGEGFNEHLLEGMANQGGGNFYFIGSPAEIPAIFMREFNELAAVTARDVELDVQYPQGVDAQVLGEWRTSKQPGHLRIHIGALNAGRRQGVYLKLLIPPASSAADLQVNIKARAKGLDEEFLQAELTARYEYADQAVVDATPARREVLERYARVDLAQTAGDALKKERRGETSEARDMVLACLAANAPYLNPKEECEYRELAERMEHGMLEMDRKQSHYRTYITKRSREG